jgi:hypothetical protein
VLFQLAVRGKISLEVRILVLAFLSTPIHVIDVLRMRNAIDENRRKRIDKRGKCTG